MKIIIKNVLVEAHNSIDLVERYHESLRRVFNIITTEMTDISSEFALQMSFKTLNDSVNSNDLVSTLLIFDAYLRMIELNASSSTIIQRFIAMKRVMNEVRKMNASKQIRNALNTRNDSFTTMIHDLSLNSLILVYREGNASQAEF